MTSRFETPIAPAAAPTPVAPAEPQLEFTKKKPNNKKAGKQRDPGASYPRKEAPKLDPNALKPKFVSTATTVEKNDPLISNSEAIFDGGMGFTEIRQILEFHIDFTGYVNLVAVSYEKMITADRSIAKYVSSSMYAYYCVVLLWRRLAQVTAQRNGKTLEYSVIRDTVSEDLPIPADICAYLNGIGNVRDHEDNHTWLKLQAEFSPLKSKGTPGFYGKITAANHWKYETLPAPGVFVLRILADIAFSEAPRVREWPLPDTITPNGDSVLLPTVSLLGWRRAEMLTDFQLQLLRGANFDADRAQVQDVYGIPVSQSLMDGIGGFIRNSKATSLALASTLTHGSLAIVPWSVKILDDDDEEPDEIGAVTPNILITAKQSKGQSPTQMGATLASSSVVFKYRFQRAAVGGTNRDGFAYRFNGGVPATWVVNRDSAFEYGVGGSNWNRAGFGSAECDGDAVQRAYCDNVRAKTTRK